MDVNFFFVAACVTLLQSLLLMVLILRVRKANVNLQVPQDILDEMTRLRRLGEHRNNGDLIISSLAYYGTLLRYAAEDWSIVLRNSEGHEVPMDMAYARTQEQVSDGETE